MAAVEAVDFMISDHGDKSPPSGFRRDFAEDKPIKSILQRNNISIPDLLKVFDFRPDDAEFEREYAQEDRDDDKLIKYRKRSSFTIGLWREVKDDLEQYDVSCLRAIRTPYVTSRTPLRVLKDEIG